MFAMLGDIPFEVVGSPDSFESVLRWDYAEHRVIEAEPRLQWLANDLERLEVGVLLHKSLADPLTSITLLRTNADAHLPLPLVLGNGQLVGTYVIEVMTTRMEQLSAVGDLIATEVHLTLREYPVEAEIDALAPPIPSFVPIAIANAGTTVTTTSASIGGSLLNVFSGVTAIVDIPPPSAPVTPDLEAGDVPTSVITRSESL
jgi:phage protein U